MADGDTATDGSSRVKGSAGCSRCYIFGCESNKAKNEDLSFHRLPPANIRKVRVYNEKSDRWEEKDRRQAWIQACRFKNSKLPKDLKICSKHFKFSDYFHPHELYPLPYIRATLKGDAVPSLHLPNLLHRSISPSILAARLHEKQARQQRAQARQKSSDSRGAFKAQADIRGPAASAVPMMEQPGNYKFHKASHLSGEAEYEMVSGVSGEDGQVFSESDTEDCSPLLRAEHALQELHDEEPACRLTDLCRLCASPAAGRSGTQHIFDQLSELQLDSIINCCLPVKVHADDALPLLVCGSCLAALRTCHNLCTSALQAQQDLTRILHQEQQLLQQPEDVECAPTSDLHITNSTCDAQSSPADSPLTPSLSTEPPNIPPVDAPCGSQNPDTNPESESQKPPLKNLKVHRYRIMVPVSSLPPNLASQVRGVKKVRKSKAPGVSPSVIKARKTILNIINKVRNANLKLSVSAPLNGSAISGQVSADSLLQLVKSTPKSCIPAGIRYKTYAEIKAERELKRGQERAEKLRKKEEEKAERKLRKQQEREEKKVVKKQERAEKRKEQRLREKQQKAEKLAEEILLQEQELAEQEVWRQLQEDAIPKIRCKLCTTIECSFPQRSFQKHMLGAHKIYICSACPDFQGASSREEFLAHRKDTKNCSWRTYPCTVCDKKFKSRVVLQSHMNMHNGVKEFTCEICAKQFYGLLHLQRHLEIHNEETHACDLCPRTFKLARYLAHHKSSVHVNNFVYTCNICNASEDCESKMQQHLKDLHIDSINLLKLSTFYVKSSPFQCEICSKYFQSKPKLYIHRAKHTKKYPKYSNSNNKNFICDQCGKTFKCKSSLRVHSNTHLAVKEFQCSYCDKSYCSKQPLVEHERLHTGEKPFTCGECAQSFHTKLKLQYHVLEHTGELPFRCATCGKRFKRSTYLTAHRVIHTGLRPIICRFCGRGFKQHADRFRHIRSLHKDQIGSC